MLNADHDCSDAAAHTTIGDVRAYNRCLRPPLISGRCVLCPPPRIPQPIICQNPADKEIWRRALQKSTSQRVPEIHLHKSTNPVQHVRVILLRRICSRPEIPSSPRCQQQTDTSFNLHKIGEAIPSHYCRFFFLIIQKAAAPPSF